MKYVFLILFLIVGCVSQERHDFEEGKRNANKGHFKVALSFFDKVVKRNSSKSVLTLEAAREAARLSFYELKDYQTAIYYYKYIILHSIDEKERLESQKQIASIYFNNLQNYQAAIIEYSKLQQMPHSDAESGQYKMNIARAQFYLNNLYQSESEIDTLLKLRVDDKTKANAKLLKGNIHLAKKEYVKAIDVFKSLNQENPQLAFEENIGLILAVCYEENNNFKEAIKVLEGYGEGTSRPNTLS